MSLSNNDLFEITTKLLETGKIKNFHDSNLNNLLFNELNDQLNDTSDTNLENITKEYLKQFHYKWKSANRTKALFVVKYAEWLSKKIIIKDITPSKIGRPLSSDFTSLSEKSKHRKTSDLQAVTPPRLQFAASIVCKKGHSSKSEVSVRPYTANEALALILDASMTKNTYQMIRNGANLRNANLYPAYNYIREAKYDCLPSCTDSWNITDMSAEINFQTLIDHTIKRIIKYVEESNNIKLDNYSELCFTAKLGFDGTSGQSLYKQINTDQSRSIEEEGSLFITCLVPLLLIENSPNFDKNVIWKNPKPSSTLFCRPVRFRYVKESIEVIKNEERYLKSVIKGLNPTVIKENIKIFHEFNITMVDGKVCTALSDMTNSTQCCSICGSSPKSMNDIEEVVKRPIDDKSLSYGLSTLHAWIRLMECCLHIAYKLPIKKWQARTTIEKDIVKKTKENIQNLFKEKTGLIVDVPKSSGFGTSNDGNTARRFFKNSYVTSEITNINVQLLDKMHVILCVLSSGRNIDCEEFRKYCMNTAKLYVSLYEWYYMPQSLHQILIHGADVIQHFNLPIGVLSEEAQEARNKDFKKFRESFTRKCSRKKTNEDLMRRLLCSSDPIISSIRKPNTKEVNTKLPDEALLLLNE